MPNNIAQIEPYWRHLAWKADLSNSVNLLANGGKINGNPVIDNGLTLDGNDSVEFVSTEGIVRAPEWTIMTKVVTPAVFTGNQTIIAQNNGAGTGRTWMYIDNLGRLTTSISGTGIIGLTNLSPSTVYWLSLTYIAGNIRLYINSTVDTLGARTPEYATGTVILGSNRLGADFYTGKIMEAEVYNVGLSTEDIAKRIEADLYNIDLSAADYYLPLISHYSDGANRVTPNYGSLGGTVLWGNGVTSTTFPTLNNRGMEVRDASTRYCTIHADGVNMDNGFIIAGKFIFDKNWAGSAGAYLFSNTIVATNRRASIGVITDANGKSTLRATTTNLFGGATQNWSVDQIDVQGEHTFTMVYAPNDTVKVRLYVDGILGTGTESAANTSTGGCFIGRLSTSNTLKFGGQLKNFVIWTNPPVYYTLQAQYICYLLSTL